MTPRILAASGIVLIAAGLICWATGLDGTLHDVLRFSLTSSARSSLVHLTTIGGLLVMGPTALVVIGLLAWRKRGEAALWLLATIVSGRLIVEGVKPLIARPRPPQADWLDPVSSWSFPSSHSAGTMLTCVGIALIVGTRSALAVAIAFAVLIGWTRLALGVHWPGDVLAGWGFALAWLGAASWVRQPPRIHKAVRVE
jgi:undecaprenyl-diphosphatase